MKLHDEEYARIIDARRARPHTYGDALMSRERRSSLAPDGYMLIDRSARW